MTPQPTQKHSLKITVSVADVEKEIELVSAVIQKHVKLPGFRNGKAPLNLVKTRFAGDIRQDVLENLIPRALLEALEKDHLKIVGTPHILDIHFHAGEPLKFEAEVETAAP